MDEQNKDMEQAIERPRFSASKKEILAAVLMYVLAYIYILSLNQKPVMGNYLIFTLGFVAFAEWILWKRARTWESWLWLGCMGLLAVRLLLRPGQFVFDDSDVRLLLHAYAVYWVLCRAGLLHGGKSSILLPLDGLLGFVILPFGSFFLRIRTLIFGVRSLRKDRKKADALTVAATVFAILLALGLLFLAAQLLSGADDRFAQLLSGLRWEWTPGETFWDFVCSLPVGAYLFGLIAGAARTEPEKMQKRGESIRRELPAIRKVPQGVYYVILGAFILLYLAFFAVQGQYLFGAFTRTLPEGFIVSEYARQGFFELCKVMAVNFVLLWLITRTNARPVREDRVLTGLCLVLLAQSVLFAVIALSKLGLYISCFGFTPKRLQSSWLAAMLLLGCIFAGEGLLRRKDRFQIWICVSGATLALLALLPF